MTDSNYEIMKRRMEAVFAAGDASAIAREWDLERRGDTLRAAFLAGTYAIDMRTGHITRGDGTDASYNEAMTLFDILSRPRCRAAGEYRTPAELSGLRSSRNAGEGIFAKFAGRFAHRLDAVSRACVRLGGVPFGRADIGFRIPVFRDLCVILQLWDADEEFGARLRFLCDAAILDFMHYESMMFMLIALLERIEAETEQTEGALRLKDTDKKGE